MKYKGDSAAKKLVRAGWWLRVHELLGESFLTGRYLCLAGHGGDVSALLALGVPPANITAVDTDIECCKLVEQRFPGVNVRHEDVANAALREWYDAVLLDFCGIFDARVLQLTARVIYAQGYGRTGALIGLLCQAGRDLTNRASSVVPTPTAEVRERWVQAHAPNQLVKERAALTEKLARGVFSLREWLEFGMRVDPVSAQQLSPSLRRSVAAVSALGAMLMVMNAKMPIGQICAGAYKSRTPSGPGVPMFIAGIETHCDEFRIGEGNLGYLEFPTPLPTLRWFALETKYDPTLLLDLDRKQVAAWRAIATRQKKAR